MQRGDIPQTFSSSWNSVFIDAFCKLFISCWIRSMRDNSAGVDSVSVSALLLPLISFCVVSPSITMLSLSASTYDGNKIDLRQSDGSMYASTSISGTFRDFHISDGTSRCLSSFMSVPFSELFVVMIPSTRAMATHDCNNFNGDTSSFCSSSVCIS